METGDTVTLVKKHKVEQLNHLVAKLRAFGKQMNMQHIQMQK